MEEEGTVLIGRVMSLLFMYTGMLATWWTSPEVVLVLEDVTHWVTLHNKETVLKDSRQTRKRYCIAANGTDPQS